MENIFENISVAVSLLALFLVIFVVLFNLYLIKRNGFYVSVNCWFCNSWTKVLYKNRNSFECPSCLQYNGFNEDGGYNQVIEAQHVTVPNKFKSRKNERASNGLCSYCNDKQQLKISQLANFSPINEGNYDVEVEHFRQLLEKTLKLCKSCEKVLKVTIEKNNAWILGNRLKNLLDLTKSSHGIRKEVKQSFFIKFIKCTLILLIILNICQILKVKVDYPIKKFTKLTPKSFDTYNIILADAFNLVQDKTRNMNEELENIGSYLPQNVSVITSSTTLVSSVGFLMQFIILLVENRCKIWKTTELLGWFIQFLTSVIGLGKHYFFLLEFLKVFSSATLLYSYLTGKPLTGIENDNKKKYAFKKLRKPIEVSDSSDEENILEEKHLSTSDSSTKSKIFRASSPIETYSVKTDTATLNRSFYTAKSTGAPSVFNQTFNTDLNRSLENLNINFGNPQCTAPVYSVKRPVLTPPKLKNITQNPWTAGGFWKSDVSVPPATVEFNNISSSSSQSSGFVSERLNNPYSSPPPSREHSFNGDMERNSILSEPAYNYKSINNDQLKPLFAPQQLYYKTDNNMFYPVLTQNNMLFVPNCAPQYQIPSTSFDNNFLRPAHHQNLDSSFSNGSLKNLPQIQRYVPQHQMATTTSGNFQQIQNLATHFGNASVKSTPIYKTLDTSISRGSLKKFPQNHNFDTGFGNRSVVSLPQPQNFELDNSSLKNFNMSNGICETSLFREKPVSNLFKNLEKIGPQCPVSQQFRQPQSPL